MSDQLEFTDRYGGGPRPDPETMCKGQCEGLGTYPCKEAEATSDELKLIEEIKSTQGRSEDGWYFIKCLDCNGTGKRPT